MHPSARNKISEVTRAKSPNSDVTDTVRTNRRQRVATANGVSRSESGPVASFNEETPECQTITCSCGHAIPLKANFCSGCGVNCLYPRMQQSRFNNMSEMAAVVERMHKGAADSVFKKVLSALDTAAKEAAETINANVETIFSASGNCGSVQGHEAVGMLHVIHLNTAAFSGHSGHHTAQQAICHMLHMIVQMTLFPHGPLMDFCGQSGPPFSGFSDGWCQYDPACVAEISVQTDSSRSLSLRRSGQVVGVRIGGGFHLLHTPEERERQRDAIRAELDRQGIVNMNGLDDLASPVSTVQSPQSPSLQEVADETLRQCHSRPITPPTSKSPTPRTTPRREEADPPLATFGKLPYGFGARSAGVPSARFHVQPYEPGLHCEAKVLGQKDMSKYRQGDGVQLSRYLAHRGRPSTPQQPDASSASAWRRTPGTTQVRPHSANNRLLSSTAASAGKETTRLHERGRPHERHSVGASRGYIGRGGVAPTRVRPASAKARAETQGGTMAPPSIAANTVYTPPGYTPGTCAAEGTHQNSIDEELPEKSHDANDGQNSIDFFAKLAEHIVDKCSTVGIAAENVVSEDLGSREVDNQLCSGL